MLCTPKVRVVDSENFYSCCLNIFLAPAFFAVVFILPTFPPPPPRLSRLELLASFALSHSVFPLRRQVELACPSRGEREERGEDPNTTTANKTLFSLPSSINLPPPVSCAGSFRRTLLSKASSAEYSNTCTPGYIGWTRFQPMQAGGPVQQLL